MASRRASAGDMPPEIVFKVKLQMALHLGRKLAVAELPAK